MPDFFRRASDAFQHRQRQDSTDSTDAPKSNEARKPSVQESLNQNPQSAEPDSHANEAFAGTATENVAPPKQRRFWLWGTRQGQKPETKQQPNQAQRDDTDWVIGT